MDGSIREAEAGDVPGLRVLRSQAIEASFSDAYDRDDFADLVAAGGGALDERVADDATTVLKAQTEVTPVGFATVECASDESTTAELLGVYVSPDYEREGFGRGLVEQVEERAREAGAQELRVTAPSVAVGFFEAVGFEVEADAEWHGLPASRLVRPLRE